MSSTEAMEAETPDVDAAAAVEVPKAASVTDVTMHPLVLLSAADHYHRVARGTSKRVVGVLLGQSYRGKVDVTNSFAVPFEEDSKNPSVFYLDHNYLESMLAMFRKVNAKENVVGFYSSGPQIRPNDLRIHDIVDGFNTKSSVFCIIDIRPDRTDLPINAYTVQDEVSTVKGQRQVQRTFIHVPCQMGAMEAEEVGVEHLLRDINDPTVSTVASLIKGKIAGLATLTGKLVECKDYLQAVCDKKLPPNQEILGNLQTIVHLLPNLNQEDLLRSLIVKTNDMNMAIYLAALIRSVIALHDLVNNKIRYGEDGTEKTLDPSSNEEKKEDEASAKTLKNKAEKKK